jgi:hypothetical protein
MLKEYDTDGDGQFSLTEVEAIVTNLIHQKKRVKEFKMVALAGVGGAILPCRSLVPDQMPSMCCSVRRTRTGLRLNVFDHASGERNVQGPIAG